MKITLSKTLILDREALFLVIRDHFRAKGYNVANIRYELDEQGEVESVEIQMCHEELGYE